MFKNFKEKISTEYEKAKVNIQSQALNLVNNGAIGQQANSEDGSSQINRNDSFTSNESKADSSNSNRYSEPGFSLVDLDDDPGKVQTTAQGSSSKKNLSSDLDSFFKTKFFSNVSSFVPQSDIESEYESETPNKGIENVSKEQLVDAIYRQRAKVKKYREKWGEVIQVYRTIIEERDKLKNVLTETQDKAFRRISELKEQCNLEQEAKRHLEENLQVLIEEKEEQIKVLQTKFDLINTGENEQLVNVGSDDKTELIEKIERLESLLAKCNESLKSNKEKLSVLTKENEQLLKYKETSERLETEVEHFKKLRESTNASFSDIKQKLHDDLESRNIIIKELKNQNEKNNEQLKRKNNELKNKVESIKTLNEKISQIESAMENEKSNLVEELSRGKTAAINLLREEYEKKIQSTNQDFESRLGNMKEENDKLKELIKEQDTCNKQAQLDEHRKQLEDTRLQNEELKSQVDKCNCKLKETIDELNKVQEERENEHKSLETVLAESELKSNKFQNEISELNERIHELDSLKQKFESTQQLLSINETKTNQANKELELIRNQLQEKDDIISKISKDAKSNEKQLRKEIQKHQQELESKQFCAGADLQEMEIKIKTLNDENYSNCNKIYELEKVIVAKDSEIINLNKLKNELENGIETANEKLKGIDQSNEQDLNQLKEERQKSDKAMEVTKKIIQKLRDENSLIQEEIQSLKAANTSISEEKNKLYDELANLNNELTNFKNKLIDIFYNAYAESEIGDISLLDYNSFLSKISASYTDSLEQNKALSENVTRLEEIIQKANENFEEKLSNHKRKISQKLDTLNGEKRNLINEISNLRNVVSQNQDIQSLLDERNAELEGCKEQIESLTAQINEMRDNVDKSKEQLEKKQCEIQDQSDKLYQIQSALSSKENELSQLQQQLAGSDDLLTMYNENVEQLKLVNIRNSQLENELKLSSNTLDDLTKYNCTYQEEIDKIKANAKEILESKQKLKDKLKQSEMKLNSMKQEHQTFVGKKTEDEQNINSLLQQLKTINEEKTQFEHRIKELESVVNQNKKREKDNLNKITELEKKISSSNLENQSQIDEFRNSKERCIELEEKLKMRDASEQDLKTEIISLEEKLKFNINAEKDLHEEMKVNDKITNSVKEQAQKYLNEIGELKIKINDMNAKHEQTIDKLYKQLEVRESQLDESLLNSNSQHNATVQDLLKSKSEVSQLMHEVEELRKVNKDLESKLSTFVKSSDENNKQSIDKYEYQLLTLQSKLEEQKQEIAVKMDQFDNQENKLISEHKDRLSQLENEITEKNAALEEVHEYYQQRLKVKDNEVKHLHEQLTSTDKNNYQINALQNSILQYHEENARLKELVNIHHDKVNDNNKSNSDMENCAILGVHLPQPTEYEYLRNILYEFMIGREPVTLAKVIAAVMRFSNEETEQIIRNQENLKTKLSLNHVK